ncbi:MAG: pyridoxal-phosphate dependent enzyme [Acidobacteriales bacterium]|nr:pyridoxal-phosphate dependent enzyme [Terriglobales bacterium]
MSSLVSQPTSAATHRLSLERIAQASEVIDSVFRDSPQFEAQPLGEKLGCRLVVKVETLNPIRSFKARGAQFFTSQLYGRPHLVCQTAGNFGQGMAVAARKHGLPITIFTSIGANALKVARMRSLGADVRTAGTTPDEAQSAAKTFAAEAGALLVEDGREAAIAEGAGTIGRELLRWPEPFDALLVPLGDGALLGGIARWVKAHSPTTRMLGVCATGSQAMERSWRRGQVVSMAAQTIADGIAVQTPFAESVADLRALIDDILLVDDTALIEGMRLAHRELGLVLEPAGAAGLAALLTQGEPFRGKLVSTVLTGGNVTPEQMRQWLNA